MLCFFAHLFDVNPISFILLDILTLEREFSFAVLNYLLGSKKVILRSFKTVILNLVVVVQCGSFGATRITFLLTVPSISNLSPIFFTAEKDVFTFFKISNSACKYNLTVAILQFGFLIFHQM